MDFLQFLRYFTPQAVLEEAFIYIIHKPMPKTADCPAPSARIHSNKYRFFEKNKKGEEDSSEQHGKQKQ